MSWLKLMLVGSGLIVVACGASLVYIAEKSLEMFGVFMVILGTCMICDTLWR